MSKGRKYEEYMKHLRYKSTTFQDVRIEAEYETDGSEIVDLFDKKVEVLFSYHPPERQTWTYPGADAELEIMGIVYEGDYYTEDELPVPLAEWIWEYLWEQRPKKHKLMP